MEKAQFKKNIHFNREEEIYVAKMITNGADYNKVAKWHLNRFAKPMHKSKFYAHRKKAAKILAESEEKNSSISHSYTRPNENEISIFEEHLKIAILERTETLDAMKWTFPLLKQFAEQERLRPEFQNLEGLKKYEFTNRYWDRFMIRKQMCFSTRKSDSKPFSENELEQLRTEMESKLMFFKKTDILNVDESAWFYRQVSGRIISRKGMSHIIWAINKLYYIGIKLRYKLSNEKQRFTFCPLICSGSLIGWKPYFISKCQGTRWCDRKFTIDGRINLPGNGRPKDYRYS